MKTAGYNDFILALLVQWFGSMIQHIRKGTERVKDARYRSRVKFANKLRPVFCGAESSMDDIGKDDAIQCIKNAPILRAYAKYDPTAIFCTECVRLLTIKE
jgi:hypothetical protein